MAGEELVLDTTYLLPIFGIGVGLEGFNELFPKLLSEHAVLYNPVSLVEAKWIVLKLAKRKPQKRDTLLERFRIGLEALLRDERLGQTELTNPDIEGVADLLLTRAGVADYFDRLIYATATSRGSVLLTEDEELARVAQRGDLPAPKRVIRWDDVVRKRPRHNRGAEDERTKDVQHPPLHHEGRS